MSCSPIYAGYQGWLTPAVKKTAAVRQSLGCLRSSSPSAVLSLFLPRPASANLSLDLERASIKRVEVTWSHTGFLRSLSINFSATKCLHLCPRRTAFAVQMAVPVGVANPIPPSNREHSSSFCLPQCERNSTTGMKTWNIRNPFLEIFLPIDEAVLRVSESFWAAPSILLPCSAVIIAWKDGDMATVDRRQRNPYSWKLSGSLNS